MKAARSTIWALLIARLGRYDKAVEYSEQALAITREVKNRAGEAVALKDLAYSESARGNLAAARTHIEESLKVSEAMRAEVISPESRASFLADVQSSYQLYTDLLMRQHRAEPTKGFDALAVESANASAPAACSTCSPKPAPMCGRAWTPRSSNASARWPNNSTTRRRRQGRDAGSRPPR